MEPLGLMIAVVLLCTGAFLNLAVLVYFAVRTAMAVLARAERKKASAAPALALASR